MNKKKWDWKGCDWETKLVKCGCYNEDRDQRKGCVVLTYHFERCW